LLRVYNARNGEMLWHAQNIGLKHDNGLMRVQNTATDRFLALLDSNLR
jgi:hypothetical protein